MVAMGGAGGSFCSAFEPSRGQAKHIRLDLKLIADAGLVGWEQKMMSVFWFSLNSLAKHWILLIYNQVPKCRKIFAPDSHVQRHASDCKLRMSVHNATTCLLFVLFMLFMWVNALWFWFLLLLYFTVTTLKPEIGKLLYEDYKQVWKRTLLCPPNF